METPEIKISANGKKQTKVFLIKAENPYELVKLMNQKFQEKNYFASTPMQFGKEWICFLYYN